MKHHLRSLAACLSLALAMPACAPSEESARDDALRYFAESVAAPEPSWAYLLPYLSRRYSLSIPLAGKTALLSAPPVYDRLLDPLATSSWAEIADLDSPIDRILATALHCDRLGLPGGWLETLVEASAHRGYALTHAVLATEWTVENGCLSAVDVALLRATQRAGLIGLLDSLEALEESDDRAADIWVEALALLAYVPGQTPLREEWRETLLALQRSDGGWPEHRAAVRSSPHTSAFALWAVLEMLEPAAAERSRTMIRR